MIRDVDLATGGGDYFFGIKFGDGSSAMDMARTLAMQLPIHDLLSFEYRIRKGYNDSDENLANLLITTLANKGNKPEQREDAFYALVQLYDDPTSFDYNGGFLKTAWKDYFCDKPHQPSKAFNFISRPDNKTLLMETFDALKPEEKKLCPE